MLASQTEMVASPRHRRDHSGSSQTPLHNPKNPKVPRLLGDSSAPRRHFSGICSPSSTNVSVLCTSPELAAPRKSTCQSLKSYLRTSGAVGSASTVTSPTRSTSPASTSSATYPSHPKPPALRRTSAPASVSLCQSDKRQMNYVSFPSIDDESCE